jgi:cytoskeleton protein RodZ
MDSVSESPEVQGAPRSPGALLAAERERQGLSRADLAQRLHMSVSQIEALEVGDYARLPRGTFLRGFTRNYARALGLDADSLVGLLAEDAPRENAPRIVVPSQNIRFDPLGQRLANPYVKAAAIALALLIFGFAGMYWWLFIRPQAVMEVTVHKSTVETPAPASPATGGPAAGGGSSAEPSASPPASPPDATPAAPAPEPTAVEPAATTTSAPPSTGAGAQPAAVSPAPGKAAPAAAPPPAEASKAAPGAALIQLAFRGAAWVEITDGKGKVLLSRTHPGGSNTEVSGQPPFNIVIGNAPEVRFTYNGREIDLAPYTRVAVARFTLP